VWRRLTLITFEARIVGRNALHRADEINPLVVTLNCRHHRFKLLFFRIAAIIRGVKNVQNDPLVERSGYFEKMMPRYMEPQGAPIRYQPTSLSAVA
jgi:hypothetical protein